MSNITAGKQAILATRFLLTLLFFFIPSRAATSFLAQVPFVSVVDCLTSMSCRSGRHLLKTVEIANLVTLCPTDDEIKAVKGYTGDVKKLGQVSGHCIRAPHNSIA